MGLCSLPTTETRTDSESLKGLVNLASSGSRRGLASHMTRDGSGETPKSKNGSSVKGCEALGWNSRGDDVNATLRRCHQ
jgi:hypothetical protein